MLSDKELFESKDNESLDKICYNYGVTIKFDVECSSSPYVQDGTSIMGRVIKYLKDCEDAMDDSMRHWGDHDHFIEPTSIELINIDTEEHMELIDKIDPYIEYEKNKNSKERS